jgi:phosphoglycolate phosphatase-like HAD superfamily hydrolase
VRASAASPAKKILVLFDIDGTLVDCGSTAGKCFAAVFRNIFGVRCPKLSPKDIAGLTDSAILSLVAAQSHLGNGALEKRFELFELYARELAGVFHSKPPRALPGAVQAISQLGNFPWCVPGLLTGSTKATARLKLDCAGIEFERFVCGAFAEDGELRKLLPPIAQSRFSQRFGNRPEMTVLVGDTPRDVEAAQATGCEFIGVASGHYDAAALVGAGASTVLANLADTAAFCRLISDLAGGSGTTSGAAAAAPRAISSS